MTPNRTIGQTPPDQANKLFAQLLETSNDAVELRERLFSELRQELELLANLQEEHLFPVLEQNPETADLVRGARDDHQQTKALLNELAATPKDRTAARSTWRGMRTSSGKLPAAPPPDRSGQRAPGMTT